VYIKTPNNAPAIVTQPARCKHPFSVQPGKNAVRKSSAK